MNRLRLDDTRLRVFQEVLILSRWIGSARIIHARIRMQKGRRGHQDPFDSISRSLSCNLSEMPPFLSLASDRLRA